MLTLVVLMIATTTASDARVAKALGIDLPPWGASVSAIEEQYLLSLPIHEPECGTGTIEPDTREWRRPGISIAGAEVSRIIFVPGSDGLEGVTFVFQRGVSGGVDERNLLDHFTRAFGMPARAGRLDSLWEVGDSFLVVSRFSVSVVKRTSRSGDFLRTSSGD